MRSLQRQNPPERRPIRTLGQVVKVQTELFRFLPCIYN